jgi:hypothetical protein
MRRLQRTTNMPVIIQEQTKNRHRTIIHGGHWSVARAPPLQQEAAASAARAGRRTERARLGSGGRRLDGQSREGGDGCRAGGGARRRSGGCAAKQGGADRMGFVGSTYKIEAQVEFLAGVGIKFWTSMFCSWTCK